MAFLNDLGKKLSQAGQATAEKAKEVSAISRINSTISEEERKIQNNYVEIGKLYYSLHNADSSPEFAALVSAITESNEKIAASRKQIQEIKGIAVCEKCGSEIPSNVAFCPSCGTPVPVKAPVEEAAAAENAPADTPQ